MREVVSESGDGPLERFSRTNYSVGAPHEIVCLFLTTHYGRTQDKGYIWTPSQCVVIKGSGYGSLGARNNHFKDSEAFSRSTLSSFLMYYYDFVSRNSFFLVYSEGQLMMYNTINMLWIVMLFEDGDLGGSLTGDLGSFPTSAVRTNLYDSS